ncbi:DUF3883 domain-containing protein [Paragemmobacter straminiformis]|uniref:DUF3883 domain-containing protein n=1 Tax=Paragemmobacter straminiformis TaxID=2045119 RepID=A0A842I4F9_9RHOB|nr:DUF3883 domain-containing protein [Gemmobacter straminiformis]MBC2834499.1 DUF3883 domain-containing protein [Gemmobacter straminiformis]
MAPSDWSDEENDTVVAEYFAMFADHLAGQQFIKAQRHRALAERLPARSEKSVEFKLQNVSGALQALGEAWLDGYAPATNFQLSLADAIVRWQKVHPSWAARPAQRGVTAFADAYALFVGPSPTLANRPPPRDLEKMLKVARKFDVAGRDARNRALGRAGEELVVAYEREKLRAAGLTGLSHKVRWVSEEDGDGAGYDIASFDLDERPRLIEVKTTNGAWDRTPFFISRNELEVAEEWRAEWCLFRLYDFARTPKAFELRPPLDAHVSLTAMTYQAGFH